MAVTPSSIKGGPRGGLLPPVPTQTKGRAPWEGLRAHLTSDRIRSCMVLFPGSRGPARRTDRKMWDSAGSRRHSSAGSPPTPHLGSLPSTTTRAEQAQACPPPCSVPPTLLCATPCAHSKPRTPHTSGAPRLRTGGLQDPKRPPPCPWDTCGPSRKASEKSLGSQEVALTAWAHDAGAGGLCRQLGRGGAGDVVWALG